jgi:hypothetical protein
MPYRQESSTSLMKRSYGSENPDHHGGDRGCTGSTAKIDNMILSYIMVLPKSRLLATGMLTKINSFLNIETTLELF